MKKNYKTLLNIISLYKYLLSAAIFFAATYNFAVVSVHAACQTTSAFGLVTFPVSTSVCSTGLCGDRLQVGTAYYKCNTNTVSPQYCYLPSGCAGNTTDLGCCVASGGGGNTPPACNDEPAAPTITSFGVNLSAGTFSGTWNINSWGCIDPYAKPYPDILIWLVDATVGGSTFVDLTKNTTSYSGASTIPLTCTHSYTLTVMKVWIINGGEKRVKTVSVPLYPACPCTNTVPAQATNLTSTVGAGTTNVTLSWLNGTNWGTVCNAASRNNRNKIVMKNSAGATIYDSGYVSPIETTTSPIECNGSYPSTIYKNNGVLESSTSFTVTVNRANQCGDTKCNCGETSATCAQDCCSNPIPTITSVTSTSSSTSSRTPIELTASATGAGISTLQIHVDKVSSTGTLLQADVAIGPNTACTGASCTSTYRWTPACGSGDSSYFKARAVATNSCGLTTTTSPEFPFRVYKSYDLNITTKLMDNPILPQAQPNCSDTSTSKSGVVISANSTNAAVPYTSTKTSVSGMAGLTSIPENVGSLNIDATLSGVQCSAYGYYCTNDSTKSPITISTAGADCSTQTASITMAETKRTSWSTVFDGNIYAKAAEVNFNCTDSVVGGGFVPALITTGPANIGGYLITEGDLTIGGSLDSSVFNPADSGGYAKKATNSSDIWFNNLSFPNTPQDVGVDSQDIIGNLDALNAKIRSSGGVYYVKGSGGNNTFNIDSALTNYTGLSIIYVEGSLNLNAPITSANGFIVFVVKGDVVINPSVKIDGYTSAINFSPDAPANVRAGIISLSKTGGITLSSNSSGDGPIIIEGFLLSKGSVLFNRDLKDNNTMYPAHVLRYPADILSTLKELSASGVFTGLETYEVTWKYE